MPRGGAPPQDDSRKRGPKRDREEEREWEEQERRRREELWKEEDLRNKLERSQGQGRRVFNSGRKFDYAADFDRGDFRYDNRGEFGGDRFREGGIFVGRDLHMAGEMILVHVGSSRGLRQKE
jgi:hypothetical protein